MNMNVKTLTGVMEIKNQKINSKNSFLFKYNFNPEIVIKRYKYIEKY